MEKLEDVKLECRKKFIITDENGGPKEWIPTIKIEEQNKPSIISLHLERRKYSRIIELYELFRSKKQLEGGKPAEGVPNTGEKGLSVRDMIIIASKSIRFSQSMLKYRPHSTSS